MPGSNGNGLRPEEEHVLGMSNTEDVSSANDGKKSITAWLGLASAIGGGALNLIMNERNNRYNREQNEQAYQQNLQMWHLQNAYNLPANQISRLKQAGLNPNLIYGNPDNTAGAPPEQQGAKGERGEIDPMAIANALMMQKQMEGIESQKEVNAATARDLNATSEGKEIDNKIKEKELNTWDENYNLKKQERIASIQKIFSAIGVDEAQAKYLYSLSDTEFEKQIGLRLDNYFKEQTMQDRIKQVSENLKLTTEQIKNVEAATKKFYSDIALNAKKGKLIDEQVITESLKRALINSNIDLNNSTISLQESAKSLNYALGYKANADARKSNAEAYNTELINMREEYLSGMAEGDPNSAVNRANREICAVVGLLGGSAVGDLIGVVSKIK